jgi:hypothetical protein
MNLLAATTGVAAAFFWFRSAMVPYPSNLRGTAPIGGLVNVNMNPLLEAVKRNGRLNKIAAALTGVAAGFGAVASFLTTMI